MRRDIWRENVRLKRHLEGKCDAQASELISVWVYQESYHISGKLEGVSKCFFFANGFFEGPLRKGLKPILSRSICFRCIWRILV